MRLAFAAILALVVGFLPVTHARAKPLAEPAMAMSCHDMMGMADHTNQDDQTPSDGMQDCADHCLSQVNARTMDAPQPGPSLVNAIRAQLGGEVNLGKAQFRDPPDPPPPRVSA
jgi:hypothetical protein